MMRTVKHTTRHSSKHAVRHHLSGTTVPRAARALVGALLVSLPLSGCGASTPPTASPAPGPSVTALTAQQVESEQNSFDYVDVRDLPTRYGIVEVNRSPISSDQTSSYSGVIASYNPNSKDLQWASRIEPEIFDKHSGDSSDTWLTTQKRASKLLLQDSSGTGVVSPDGQHISLILEPHRLAHDDDFSVQRTYVVVLSAETGKLEGSVEVSGLILGRVLTSDSLAVQTARNYYPGADGQGVISVYPLSDLAAKPSTIPTDHWLVGASRDSLLLSPQSPSAGNDWRTEFRPFTVTQMGTDGQVRRTITGVNQIYPGGWLERFSDPAAAAALAPTTVGKDDDQTRAAWNALPTQIVDTNSGATHDLTGATARSHRVPTGPGLVIRRTSTDESGGTTSGLAFWLSAADDGHPHTENLEQFDDK